MRRRHFCSSAVQNALTAGLIVSLFYAPLLALQPKAVRAAAPKTTLHARNFAQPLTAFAVAWRKLTSLLQTSVNLDTLRGTTPQASNAYQPWPLPPSSYDDPKPTDTASYDTLLTYAVQPANATGPVGALPLQAPDPTVSNSVTAGLSADILRRRFNFTAPVVQLAGRAGMDLSLALSYSSNIWAAGGGFNVDRGFPAPGWRLGFGAILVRDPVNGVYFNSVTQQYSIIYLAPDGTRHDLRSAGGGVYESYDGSYLQFNATTQVLSFPNGAKLLFGAYSYSANNHDYLALPVKITDRQGNFITIVYRTLTFGTNNEKTVIDHVIDTAARRIDFEYTDNRLTAVKQYRDNGWFYFVRLDYLPVTLQTGDPAWDGTQVWMLGRITYPTGASLRFSFNGYGQISKSAKWAPAINGQGGEREVAATTFGYASNGFAGRNEAAENWQGYAVIYSLGAYGQRVSDGQVWYEANLNGLTYELCTINPAGNVDVKIKRVITTYQQDANVPYQANLRPVETQIWDSISGGPSWRIKKTSFEYTQEQGLWLLRNQYEGDSSAFYRRLETLYTHYPTQRILGLPAQVSVYRGNGTLMSRVQNVYDQTGSYIDANNQPAEYLKNEPNAVLHEATYDQTFTTRGNLTSVVQVNAADVNQTRTVKRVFYDTNGNLRGAADAARQRGQIDYTDNYSNKPVGLGPTQVYPYITTTPELTAMRAGMQHEYYTGHVNKSFSLAPGSSAELQAVQTSYDFAGRPWQTTKPDGGWVRTDYWDNLLVAGTAQQIETGKVRYKWEFMDGAGHPFKKASDHPDGVTGKYAGQLFAYDGLGRVKDSSNVLRIDGAFLPVKDNPNDPNEQAPSWLFTNMTYDVFSRMTMAKKPDLNEVHVDYEGCGCAGNMTKRVTDELGNYTETQTDLFGRLAVTIEPPLPPGGNYLYYSKAEYFYDALDRLTEIKHSGNSYPYSDPGASQSRYFTYDGWGRLATETTPEAGTVSYTYKPNDLVEAVTNANGKTTTYTYDKRNLPTTVGYSDGTTPNVGYQYDAYGARTQMTDGAGQTSYSYNGLRQLQSEARTFTGLAGNSYGLSYSYNQGEQVQSVNYQAVTLAVPPNGSPATETDKGSGAAGPFTISGTVSTAQGQPVANAALSTYLPGAIHPTLAYTNSQWQYTFNDLPAAGSYTITPSLAGYVFSPYPRTYNNLQASRSNANFTATSNAPQPTVTFDKRVNYAYNTVGALSGAGTNLIGTDPNNTSNVINSLSFKAFGAIKQLNYGNGLQLTMGYNANRQQPITMKVGPNGTGSIIDYTYEYYDATGNNNNRIRKITDGVDSAYTVNYSYDQWNRLTNATAPAYGRGYVYDAWGNLRGAGGGPYGGYVLNYGTNANTAPATNRILSVTESSGTQPFSYDNAGNTTAGDGMTYTYDAANRLVSVNGGALGQYGYDGAGMRVKKVEGGGTTYYVRSSKLGNTAFEVAGTGIQRAYIYSSGGKLIAEQATDGQFYWHHTNHLSSARAMTGTSGNLVYRGQFDPHGQALSEWSASGNTNLSTKKFTGYERDTVTGLDYAEARTYKGGRGRFMQADPIGLKAVQASQPQSLNRYSYVKNDPVNFRDPKGTYCPAGGCYDLWDLWEAWWFYDGGQGKPTKDGSRDQGEGGGGAIGQ